MQTIYISVGHFNFNNAIDSIRTPVACFWDHADAKKFCEAENTAEGAEVLEVEEHACVDNYGVPVTRREYAELFPHVLDYPSQFAHYSI